MPPVVTTSRRRRPRKNSPHHILAVAAIAFLCVAGVFCAKYLRKPAGEPPATVARPSAHVVEPATDRADVAQLDVAPPLTTNNVSEATATPRRLYNGKEVISSSIRTNGNGDVIEKVVLADGTKASIVSPRPPVFANAAEQVIALALSTPSGESMPPLPDLNGIDADFEKSLLEPIVINEDDPEDVKELKERVAEAKAYIAEEIKKGGNMIDILMEHQDEMERMANARLSAIRGMQAVYAEKGLADAQRYAREMNKSLEADGIPPIPVIGAGGSD